MTKKINSVELEKIIAEELEKALLEEGLGDLVRRVAGTGKAAVQGAVEKGKERWQQIGQQQADMKSIEADLKKIADFIEFTRGDKEIGPLISRSAIGKHLFGDSQAQMMSEQFESQILKMLKTIKPEELKGMVDDFKQKVMANPRAAEVMNQLTGMSVSAEPTQPASAQPVAGQAAEPEAGQPTAAVQQTPTDQTQPASAQPTAGSGDKQSIVGRMGDIVSQRYSEQEPVSNRKTPAKGYLIGPNRKDSFQYQAGYKLLATNLKLNWETQVKPMFDYLASKGLLYRLGSIQEQENPAKIWQDFGINTEGKLRAHQFFTSLINDIHTNTNLNKNTVITPFLIAVWKQGKLVMPYNEKDNDRNTKQDSTNSNTSITPGRKLDTRGAYSSGPIPVGKKFEENNLHIQELKRLKELAGILKD